MIVVAVVAGVDVCSACPLHPNNQNVSVLVLLELNRSLVSFSVFECLPFSLQSVEQPVIITNFVLTFCES